MYLKGRLHFLITIVTPANQRSVGKGQGHKHDGNMKKASLCFGGTVL